MKKFGRKIVAGLQLVFVGWLAYLIGGEAAYQDFRNQLKKYTDSGVVDTSWVKKYF